MLLCNGLDGLKVGVNPKNYEIHDRKLYLFYDSFFNNTLKSWKEENPKRLIKQADVNWEKVVKE